MAISNRGFQLNAKTRADSIEDKMKAGKSFEFSSAIKDLWSSESIEIELDKERFLIFGKSPTVDAPSTTSSVCWAKSSWNQVDLLDRPVQSWFLQANFKKLLNKRAECCIYWQATSKRSVKLPEPN